VNYYIIKESADYADEFNVEGFGIYESSLNEEELLLKIIENFPYSGEIYFGTNEWIEITNEEELSDAIYIEEISEQEYNTIFKIFEGNSGGMTPINDRIYEIICN